MTVSGRHRVIKTLREDPRVRRFAIPAYRGLTKMLAYGTGPRVLVNSVHKSGTHLVTTLVRQLPGTVHSGRHYVLDNFRTTPERPAVWGETPEVDWHRLRDTFASFNHGQFLTSHFQAEPELLSILDELGFRTVFIVRDPRDVVVSSTFYMTRLERHVMHRRYAEDFTTDHDRIMATITGFPPGPNGLGSVSIARRIEGYLAWPSAPGVHGCRFEDLVGPNGGGDPDVQRTQIEAIARHLGHSPTEEHIDRLARKTWSENSPTFRKGAIGDWRNHFTDEHKAAFKEVAGDHLIALGYEPDLDW